LPTSERKFEYVPDIEVVAALHKIVNASFGISEEGAITAAYNMLGFGRVTDNAKSRGGTILATKILSGEFSKRDGLLRPA
jgi:hypothetical protein